MSSYDSTHSGYTHPSQYPPNPPQQQQRPQPPYPTTPGPANNSAPSAFYPPAPPQQGTYSTSPTYQPHQQFYSTSPNQQFTPFNHHQQQFYSTSPTQPTHQRASHRRASSLSYTYPPQQPSTTTAPIQIPPRTNQQPMHARHGSHSSHHSSEDERHDSSAAYGLDEDTLRQYEKRYAREKRMERRPTMGESVISFVRVLSGKR